MWGKLARPLYAAQTWVPRGQKTLQRTLMPSKQDILNEIVRTASENGGKPLGSRRFEREASVTSNDWGRYWARFGDALKEAGFTPNELQEAHPTDFLIEKLVPLIRKLQRFPTYREINVARNADPELPVGTVYQRLGTKKQLIEIALAYCRSHPGHNDVTTICDHSVGDAPSVEQNNPASNEQVGEVYLFKSGKFFKIGRSKDTVRRGAEIRVQLPEKIDLVHSIKTDDPSGVEAYWHRRFEARRLQGEWFDLKPSDVKVFKRWRRIF
jgi:hypothetical protein